MIAAAAVVVALGGLAAAARLALGRRRAPLLPPPLESAPPVVALLPVRDEEANVEACLTALLAQSAPVAVRAIDDGSTDATAAIVERLARADRRVELVRVTTPPAPGKSGKVNALAIGSRGVEVPWLLGIDADARPAPDAVARALSAARRERLDAVSLAARQRVGSPGEALLTPLVMALLDALLGDWRRTARGEGEPVANGQFLLVRRDALEAIGGYAAIADQPLDDVALARRLVAGGFRVGFWRARGQLEVRMYVGFRSTWRGWRRNLALLVGARPALATLAATLPLLPAAGALAALAAGSPLAALVAWLGGAGASALARAGTGSSPAWGALYPFDASVLAGCLACAVADRQRGEISPWRGRPLAAQRSGVEDDASGAE